MRARVIFILSIAVLLFSACTTESKNANVTRDRAIQIVDEISNSAGADTSSYPEMDKVVDNVRYYFVQVVYANRMTAAYFVDENVGNVYIAMGGELDTENPLQTANSGEETTDAAEITASETEVIKDIFDAIGMTGGQVEQKFGKGYKKVSVNYDNYMEGFLYSDLGITVAFGSDGTVARVYCTDKIDIDGVRSGMDFSQIKEKFGETSYRQTWADIPTNTSYEIKYRFNNRTVVFFSHEKDGSNSIMCIS